MPRGAQRDPQLVVFLGGPASGKGTQARLLARALGVPHISSGELLRTTAAAAAATTDSGMPRGDLVADDVVTQLLLARLAQPDAEHGAVLDGFPRTLAQARALDEWLERRGGRVKAAFYLDVPSEVMVERAVQRGQIGHRSDDSAEIARRRVDVFLEELPSLLDYYAARGVLHRIDGTQAVEQIHEHISRLSGQPGPPAR
jgi:adenylate kinase